MSDETTTPENSGAEAGNALAEAVKAAHDAKEEKVDFAVAGEERIPFSGIKLTVDVARSDWDRRTEKFFKDVQPNVALEGFRRGKAPVALLKARFAQAALADIAEKVTPLVVRDVAREKNLTIYGSPNITDIKNESGKPVTLTIELEVKPDIAPTNYTGRTVEVPQRKLKDAMVDSRLEALRAKHATFVEEDKAFQPGDALVLDLQVTDANGLTVKTETDKLFENPPADLPVTVVADLFDKSKDYSGEAQDQDGNSYRFSIKSVRARKLPELDDEFAKDLEKGSLEELKTSIVEELQKEIDSVNEDAAFDKLVEILLAEHDFEVPPTLRNNVAQELAQQDYMQLRYTGRMPSRLMAGVDEDGNRSRQAYEALLQRDGTNRVRGYLLIDAIGLKENLVPSEEDIEAALAERAAQEGRKPIAIRAALERQRRWNDFVESVRFDKVRKYLLDQTTINWTEYVEPVAEESGDDAAAESSKA